VEKNGRIPPGNYATTGKQIGQTEEPIQKADVIAAGDPDLQQRLAGIGKNIAAITEHRSHGNKLAACGALVLGLVYTVYRG